MNRSSVKILLYFLLGSFLMSLSAWVLSAPVARVLVRINLTAALILSLVLTLVALFVCLAGEGVILSHRLRSSVRHRFYRVSYFINAAASGIAVGALMTEKGLVPSAELLLCMLPVVLLALAMCGIQHFPSKSYHKAATIIITALDIIFLLCGVCVWICLSASAGCAMVFHSLFFLLFPTGARFAERNPGEWYRYLSYTGFGAFALILIAVILILSDGEAVDFLDIGGVDSPGSKSTKKQFSAKKSGKLLK